MIITSIKRHTVYHARDTFIFPVAPETLNPLFCPAAGRRSALPSQGCGWMGDRAIGRALSIAKPIHACRGSYLLPIWHLGCREPGVGDRVDPGLATEK
ncbi:hypothetical protein Smlt2352 [Stenotrophomonas maltophilia K279a]|uniref:Uncharacterized protein n=1 Tax=Stenotrophomonas maltophilia (strain K279a) TaxID=522373 RepID=B2FRE2_STRMK|nr:hypothetical protein Smlt2352 [Stenotrophomonas maltophilia K279a]